MTFARKVVKIDLKKIISLPRYKLMKQTVSLKIFNSFEFPNANGSVSDYGMLNSRQLDKISRKLRPGAIL
jgi:hypothetical protein